MFHTQGVRRSGGALGDTWIRNENQNPKTSKTKSMPSMKYRYVFSDRSGLTRNCVVMVALPFNQMDSIFGTKVGATPLIILICKLYQTLSLGVQYRTRRCISHSPGGGFQARLLDSQEGAYTKRCVFGKLSARCFRRRPFRRRHYSDLGDID